FRCQVSQEVTATRPTRASAATGRGAPRRATATAGKTHSAEARPRGKYGRSSLSISASGTTDEDGLSSAAAATPTKVTQGCGRQASTRAIPTSTQPVSATTKTGSPAWRTTG